MLSKNPEPCVIIIGCNHINTLGLIRSIGENGIKPHVILEPCNRKFCTLKFSKYVNSFYILKDGEDLTEYIISTFGFKSNKPAVLCGSDRSILELDAQYEVLSKHFKIFNINNKAGKIGNYLSKIATFPLAEKAGLQVIKTFNPKSDDFDIRKIPVPCLVKGNNSTSSTKSDMVICHSLEEVKKALASEKDLLVQEYIKKDFELDIVGLSLEHGKKVYISGAVRKIREAFESQSQFISLDTLKSYPQIDVKCIRQFILELGYEGIFSIEFLVCGKRSYFLEINLRNDGISYIFTKAGWNYPMDWVNYCYGKPNYQSDKKEPQLPIYAMQLSDISNVMHGQVGLWNWLIQLNKCRCFFTLSYKDPKPFLYQCYIPFRQLFKKLTKIFKLK